MASFTGSLSLLAILVFGSCPARTQKDVSSNVPSQFCRCMEYWACIGSGGKPYSYCNYNQVCCFVEKNARSVGILPRKAKVSKCGEKGQDSGKDGEAEPGEWAWQAAILEKKEEVYVCGASLLDEYWILTAAHCVDDYVSNVSDLKIRLGEYDVSSNTESLRHEEFDVERIVLNPEFNNNTLAHDIALVRMAKAAKRKPNINIVCMPDKGMAENDLVVTTRCFVTGWGRKNESSDHSVVLKEVNVPIWKSVDCEKALKDLFGPTFHLPNTCLCAGAEGKDACDGDGGGPLVCEKNGHWYQVGIVSYGVGCGRPNSPGVYTKVDTYKKWIHKVVLNS